MLLQIQQYFMLPNPLMNKQENALFQLVHRSQLWARFQYYHFQYTFHCFVFEYFKWVPFWNYSCKLNKNIFKFLGFITNVSSKFCYCRKSNFWDTILKKKYKMVGSGLTWIFRRMFIGNLLFVLINTIRALKFVNNLYERPV